MRISDWSSDVCSSDLDFAELRAPADGIISKRLVQHGQVVAAGTELLRLIRDGRLEWRAALPADDLALVEAGATGRQRGVEGKRVSVHVYLRGRRIIHNKKQTLHTTREN